MGREIAPHGAPGLILLGTRFGERYTLPSASDIAHLGSPCPPNCVSNLLRSGQLNRPGTLVTPQTASVLLKLGKYLTHVALSQDCSHRITPEQMQRNCTPR